MTALGSRPLTGRSVLVMLLAFFGVVAAVNTVFLVVALSTHPGVETEDAYRRGLAYNEEMRIAEAQAAAGWFTEFEHDAEAKTLRATIFDRRNRGLTSLRVTGRAERPAHASDDFAVKFAEDAAGRYVAPFAPPLPGQWLVRIEAKDRRGRIYRETVRVWSK